MSILRWAFIMLLVSLVAALFGFTELSAASADVSRVLFYIFVRDLPGPARPRPDGFPQSIARSKESARANLDHLPHDRRFARL